MKKEEEKKKKEEKRRENQINTAILMIGNQRIKQGCFPVKYICVSNYSKDEMVFFRIKVME